MGTPLPQGFLPAHLILRIAEDTLKMQIPRAVLGRLDWTGGWRVGRGR